MPKILMLGCGNIGSRTLQALVGLNPEAFGNALRIDVVEPVEAARDLAAERAQAALPNGQAATPSLTFHADLDSAALALGGGADLVIVSTTSGPRFEITKQAIERLSIGRLLLEKFLFTERTHYDEMQAILDDAGIAAWVNCPRNAWPGYRALATRLGERSAQLQMTVSGGGFNLASNAIHFLSLYRFLSGSAFTEVDGRDLQPTPEGNRRSGYRELCGALSARTATGGHLRILDFAPSKQPITITLAAPGLVGSIDEAKGLLRWRGTASDWIWQEEPFETLMMSQTTVLFEDLLHAGTATLPDYASAAADHLLLFDAFNTAFFPDAPGQTNCPVT